MSDSTTAKTLIKRYIIARIPLITIDSIERSRVLDTIKEIRDELMIPIWVHTLSKGIVDVETNKVIREDKSIYGAIEFMSEQMLKRQNLTMVFTEVPDISTDTADAKQFKDLITLANEQGGSIVILSDKPVWNQLQRLGLIVQVDMPNEDEMYSILSAYIDDYRTIIPVEWDESDIREAASILAGVTQIEAENVIAALVANKSITKKRYGRSSKC